jgi:rfaE bifunctional protein nucleotidyltransferase chain/domain/rfaE bifunctional protein kinase chain/domain
MIGRKPVVLVVGDSLLDRDHRGTSHRLAPDAPVPVVDGATTTANPGGAALAALILASMDVEAHLLTALADDIDGVEIAETLQSAGVRLHGLRARGATRTRERVISGDTVLARLDRGRDRLMPMEVDMAAIEAALDEADAILVSDHGGGMLLDPTVNAALRRARSPIVWDPDPSGATPIPGCRVVTPNEDEARIFAGDDDPASILEVADLLRRTWYADSVAVTLGARGATLVATGTALFAPTSAVNGDSSGAGTAFAAAMARALAVGERPEAAITPAVAYARAWVGRRSGPASVRTPSSVRAAGGKVVATGGCFDIIHRGHLATLRAAAALGDHLIVCMNSDASVRAAKGPARPFVTQDDRRAILEALDMVDEVVVFDEQTPEQVLRRIRPDIWVTDDAREPGGSPEDEVVAEWGGQVVTVPHLEGHSTTHLAQSIGAVIDIRDRLRQERL